MSIQSIATHPLLRADQHQYVTSICLTPCLKISNSHKFLIKSLHRPKDGHDKIFKCHLEINCVLLNFYFFDFCFNINIKPSLMLLNILCTIC